MKKFIFIIFIIFSFVILASCKGPDKVYHKNPGNGSENSSTPNNQTGGDNNSQNNNQGGIETPLIPF